MRMGRPQNHPLTVAEAKAQLRAATRRPPVGPFYGALDRGLSGEAVFAVDLLRRHPYAAAAAVALAGAVVARSPNLQRALLLALTGADQ